MSFRTLVINSPSKLDYKNNKMIIRCLLEDKRREIFLEELEVIILEEQRITITNVLLKELLNNNIKMIVCDEKHNPIGEMYPYAVKFDASAQLHKQVQWTNENKRRVWKLIVQEKIRQQRLLLEHLKTDKTELLLEYENGVVDGDDTGRESISAKVYFNQLFGYAFRRRNDHAVENGLLNYGYAILLSICNRDIAGCGYNNLLGINHKGQKNSQNLGCDIMETFRPVVDYFVATYRGNIEELDPCIKRKLLHHITYAEIYIDGKMQKLSQAIHIYSMGIYHALDTGDITKIKSFHYRYTEGDNE